MRNPIRRNLPHRSHRNRINQNRINRTGFTLVELLVAMIVIAILAGMILIGMQAATEHARRTRTKTLITKLDSMLMQRYNQFRTWRVPHSVHASQLTSGSKTPKDVAGERLDALRYMMMQELPDRWSDFQPTVNILPVNASAFDRYHRSPDHTGYFTAGRYAYSSVWSNEVWPKVLAKHGGDRIAALDNLYEHQGAECLYMIIMYGGMDGRGRAAFSESDIGDVDGDGAPEFLDGWGNPIEYLLWAPGFDSPMQSIRYRGGGAQATAVVNPNTGRVDDIDSITVVNGGSGYAIPPLVLITGGGGTGARFKAEIDGNGRVTRIIPADFEVNPSSTTYRGTGYAPAPAPQPNVQVIPAGTGDPINDHDPFDYLAVHLGAFRLVPLIYSAGPDGVYGIHRAPYYARIRPEDQRPNAPPSPDPYCLRVDPYFYHNDTHSRNVSFYTYDVRNYPPPSNEFWPPLGYKITAAERDEERRPDGRDGVLEVELQRSGDWTDNIHNQME